MKTTVLIGFGIAIALCVNSNSKDKSSNMPSISDAEKACQLALVKNDIDNLIDWSDTKGVFIDFGAWKQRVSKNLDGDYSFNSSLFVAFSRSCLFSAPKADEFLKDENLRKSSFGGLVIFNVTHASIRPPAFGKRYLAGGGMILGIMPKNPEISAPILYLGVSDGDTIIDKNIKIGHVEFVDSSFNDFKFSQNDYSK